jgi:hypothetical protein
MLLPHGKMSSECSLTYTLLLAPHDRCYNQRQRTKNLSYKIWQRRWPTCPLASQLMARIPRCLSTFVVPFEEPAAGDLSPGGAAS